MSSSNTGAFNSDEKGSASLGLWDDDPYYHVTVERLALGRILYNEYCEVAVEHWACYLDDSVMVGDSSDCFGKMFTENLLSDVQKRFPHLSENSARLVLLKTWKDMPVAAVLHFRNMVKIALGGNASSDSQQGTDKAAIAKDSTINERNTASSELVAESTVSQSNVKTLPNKDNEQKAIESSRDPCTTRQLHSTSWNTFSVDNVSHSSEHAKTSRSAEMVLVLDIFGPYREEINTLDYLRRLASVQQLNYFRRLASSRPLNSLRNLTSIEEEAEGDSKHNAILKTLSNFSIPCCRTDDRKSVRKLRKGSKKDPSKGGKTTNRKKTKSKRKRTRQSSDMDEEMEKETAKKLAGAALSKEKEKMDDTSEEINDTDSDLGGEEETGRKGLLSSDEGHNSQSAGIASAEYSGKPDDSVYIIHAQKVMKTEDVDNLANRKEVTGGNRIEDDVCIDLHPCEVETSARSERIIMPRVFLGSTSLQLSELMEDYMLFKLSVVSDEQIDSEETNAGNRICGREISVEENSEFKEINLCNSVNDTKEQLDARGQDMTSHAAENEMKWDGEIQIQKNEEREKGSLEMFKDFGEAENVILLFADTDKFVESTVKGLAEYLSQEGDENSEKDISLFFTNLKDASNDKEYNDVLCEQEIQDSTKAVLTIDEQNLPEWEWKEVCKTNNDENISLSTREDAFVSENSNKDDRKINIKRGSSASTDDCFRAQCDIVSTTTDAIRESLLLAKKRRTLISEENADKKEDAMISEGKEREIMYCGKGEEIGEDGRWMDVDDLKQSGTIEEDDMSENETKDAMTEEEKTKAVKNGTELLETNREKICGSSDRSVKDHEENKEDVLSADIAEERVDYSPTPVEQSEEDYYCDKTSENELIQMLTRVPAKTKIVLSDTTINEIVNSQLDFKDDSQECDELDSDSCIAHTDAGECYPLTRKPARINVCSFDPYDEADVTSSEERPSCSIEQEIRLPVGLHHVPSLSMLATKVRDSHTLDRSFSDASINQKERDEWKQENRCSSNRDFLLVNVNRYLDVSDSFDAGNKEAGHCENIIEEAEVRRDVNEETKSGVIDVKDIDKEHVENRFEKNECVEFEHEEAEKESIVYLNPKQFKKSSNEGVKSINETEGKLENELFEIDNDAKEKHSELIQRGTKQQGKEDINVKVIDNKITEFRLRNILHGLDSESESAPSGTVERVSKELKEYVLEKKELAVSNDAMKEKHSELIPKVTKQQGNEEIPVKNIDNQRKELRFENLDGTLESVRKKQIEHFYEEEEIAASNDNVKTKHSELIQNETKQQADKDITVKDTDNQITEIRSGNNLRDFDSKIERVRQTGNLESVLKEQTEYVFQKEELMGNYVEVKGIDSELTQKETERQGNKDNTAKDIDNQMTEFRSGTPESVRKELTKYILEKEVLVASNDEVKQINSELSQKEIKQQRNENIAIKDIDNKIQELRSGTPVSVHKEQMEYVFETEELVSRIEVKDKYSELKQKEAEQQGNGDYTVNDIDNQRTEFRSGTVENISKEQTEYIFEKEELVASNDEIKDMCSELIPKESKQQESGDIIVKDIDNQRTEFKPGNILDGLNIKIESDLSGTLDSVSKKEFTFEKDETEDFYIVSRKSGTVCFEIVENKTKSAVDKLTKSHSVNGKLRRNEELTTEASECAQGLKDHFTLVDTSKLLTENINNIEICLKRDSGMMSERETDVVNEARVANNIEHVIQEDFDSELCVRDSVSRRKIAEGGKNRSWNVNCPNKEMDVDSDDRDLEKKNSSFRDSSDLQKLISESKDCSELKCDKSTPSAGDNVKSVCNLKNNEHKTIKENNNKMGTKEYQSMMNDSSERCSEISRCTEVSELSSNTSVSSSSMQVNNSGTDYFDYSDQQSDSPAGSQKTSSTSYDSSSFRQYMDGKTPSFTTEQEAKFATNGNRKRYSESSESLELFGVSSDSSSSSSLDQVSNQFREYVSDRFREQLIDMRKVSEPLSFSVIKEETEKRMRSNNQKIATCVYEDFSSVSSEQSMYTSESPYSSQMEQTSATEGDQSFSEGRLGTILAPHLTASAENKSSVDDGKEVPRETHAEKGSESVHKGMEKCRNILNGEKGNLTDDLLPKIAIPCLQDKRKDPESNDPKKAQGRECVESSVGQMQTQTDAKNIPATFVIEQKQNETDENALEQIREVLEESFFLHGLSKPKQSSTSLESEIEIEKMPLFAIAKSLEDQMIELSDATSLVPDCKPDNLQGAQKVSVDNRRSSSSHSLLMGSVCETINDKGEFIWCRVGQEDSQEDFMLYISHEDEQEDITKYELLLHESDFFSSDTSLSYLSDFADENQASSKQDSQEDEGIRSTQGKDSDLCMPSTGSLESLRHGSSVSAGATIGQNEGSAVNDSSEATDVTHPSQNVIGDNDEHTEISKEAALQFKTDANSVAAPFDSGVVHFEAVKDECLVNYDSMSTVERKAESCHSEESFVTSHLEPDLVYCVDYPRFNDDLDIPETERCVGKAGSSSEKQPEILLISFNTDREQMPCLKESLSNTSILDKESQGYLLSAYLDQYVDASGEYSESSEENTAKSTSCSVEDDVVGAGNSPKSFESNAEEKLSASIITSLSADGDTWALMHVSSDSYISDGVLGDLDDADTTSEGIFADSIQGFLKSSWKDKLIAAHEREADAKGKENSEQMIQDRVRDKFVHEDREKSKTKDGEQFVAENFISNNVGNEIKTFDGNDICREESLNLIAKEFELKKDACTSLAENKDVLIDLDLKEQGKSLDQSVNIMSKTGTDNETFCLEEHKKSCTINSTSLNVDTNERKCSSNNKNLYEIPLTANQEEGNLCSDVPSVEDQVKHKFHNAHSLRMQDIIAGKHREMMPITSRILISNTDENLLPSMTHDAQAELDKRQSIVSIDKAANRESNVEGYTVIHRKDGIQSESNVPEPSELIKSANVMAKLTDSRETDTEIDASRLVEDEKKLPISRDEMINRDYVKSSSNAGDSGMRYDDNEKLLAVRNVMNDFPTICGGITKALVEEANHRIVDDTSCTGGTGAATAKASVSQPCGVRHEVICHISESTPEVEADFTSSATKDAVASSNRGADAEDDMPNSDNGSKIDALYSVNNTDIAVCEGIVGGLGKEWSINDLSCSRINAASRRNGNDLKTRIAADEGESEMIEAEKEKVQELVEKSVSSIEAEEGSEERVVEFKDHDLCDVDLSLVSKEESPKKRCSLESCATKILTAVLKNVRLELVDENGENVGTTKILRKESDAGEKEFQDFKSFFGGIKRGHFFQSGEENLMTISLEQKYLIDEHDSVVSDDLKESTKSKDDFCGEHDFDNIGDEKMLEVIKVANKSSENEIEKGNQENQAHTPKRSETIIQEGSNKTNDEEYCCLKNVDYKSDHLKEEENEQWEKKLCIIIHCLKELLYIEEEINIEISRRKDEDVLPIESIESEDVEDQTESSYFCKDQFCVNNDETKKASEVTIPEDNESTGIDIAMRTAPLEIIRNAKISTGTHFKDNCRSNIEQTNERKDCQTEESHYSDRLKVKDFIFRTENMQEKSKEDNELESDQNDVCEKNDKSLKPEMFRNVANKARNAVKDLLFNNLKSYRQQLKCRTDINSQSKEPTESEGSNFQKRTAEVTSAVCGKNFKHGSVFRCKLQGQSRDETKDETERGDGVGKNDSKNQSKSKDGITEGFRRNKRKLSDKGTRDKRNNSMSSETFQINGNGSVCEDRKVRLVSTDIENNIKNWKENLSEDISSGKTSRIKRRKRRKRNSAKIEKERFDRGMTDSGARDGGVKAISSVNEGAGKCTAANSQRAIEESKETVRENTENAEKVNGIEYATMTDDNRQNHEITEKEISFKVNDTIGKKDVKETGKIKNESYENGECVRKDVDVGKDKLKKAKTFVWYNRVPETAAVEKQVIGLMDRGGRRGSEKKYRQKRNSRWFDGSMTDESQDFERSVDKSVIVETNAKGTERAENRGQTTQDEGLETTRSSETKSSSKKEEYSRDCEKRGRRKRESELTDGEAKCSSRGREDEKAFKVSKKSRTTDGEKWESRSRVGRIKGSARTDGYCKVAAVELKRNFGRLEKRNGIGTTDDQGKIERAREEGRSDRTGGKEMFNDAMAKKGKDKHGGIEREDRSIAADETEATRAEGNKDCGKQIEGEKVEMHESSNKTNGEGRLKEEEAGKCEITLQKGNEGETGNAETVSGVGRKSNGCYNRQVYGIYERRCEIESKLDGEADGCDLKYLHKERSLRDAGKTDDTDSGERANCACDADVKKREGNGDWKKLSRDGSMKIPEPEEVQKRCEKPRKKVEDLNGCKSVSHSQEKDVGSSDDDRKNKVKPSELAFQLHESDENLRSTLDSLNFDCSLCQKHSPEMHTGIGNVGLVFENITELSHQSKGHKDMTEVNDVEVSFRLENERDHSDRMRFISDDLAHPLKEMKIVLQQNAAKCRQFPQAFRSISNTIKKVIHPANEGLKKTTSEEGCEPENLFLYDPQVKSTEERSEVPLRYPRKSEGDSSENDGFATDDDKLMLLSDSWASKSCKDRKSDFGVIGSVIADESNEDGKLIDCNLFPKEEFKIDYCCCSFNFCDKMHGQTTVQNIEMELDYCCRNDSSQVHEKNFNHQAKSEGIEVKEEETERKIIFPEFDFTENSSPVFKENYIQEGFKTSETFFRCNTMTGTVRENIIERGNKADTSEHGSNSSDEIFERSGKQKSSKNGKHLCSISSLSPLKVEVMNSCSSVTKFIDEQGKNEGENYERNQSNDKEDAVNNTSETSEKVREPPVQNNQTDSHLDSQRLKSDVSAADGAETSGIQITGDDLSIISKPDSSVDFVTSIVSENLSSMIDLTRWGSFKENEILIEVSDEEEEEDKENFSVAYADLETDEK